MLFFKLRTDRYGLGLSNEPLFIIIAQGAAKLWPIKVGDLKKIKDLTPDHTRGARVADFFQTSNFDRSQFCNPLSYDDEKWLIWKPQAISIGTQLKKQHITIFNICLNVLKSSNLLHCQGLGDSQLQSIVNKFKLYPLLECRT